MRKALDYVDRILLNAASTDFPLRNGLPRGYLTWGLQLDVRLRDVVGVANLASIIYGSPTTFLENIQVRGDLAGRGETILFDLSGRQTWQYYRALRGVPSYVNPDDFVVDAGAIATYDIRVSYVIPFVAMGSPAMERATLAAANMFSQFNLTVRRGGAESLGINAGASTQTFSDFGVGTGDPTLDIHRIIVKEGQGKAMRAPLICQKVRELSSTEVVTTGTDRQLAQLSTGALIGRIFLLTGTSETDTQQNGELASASNAIIDLLRLRQNQQLLRNFRYRAGSYWGMHEHNIDAGGGNLLTSQAPQAQTGDFLRGERVGECLIDFVGDGNLNDVLNPMAMPSRGQDLFIYGDVTGAANQVLEVITERYMPMPR